MGDLTRHDELFHRLICDRDLRQRVRVEGWSAAGEAAGVFSGIDMDELEKLATEVRDGLIRGSLGGLGLGRAFPRTIEALGDDAASVVERFLADTGGAAPDGRRVDATGRQAGISILEAFHGWAELQLASRAPARCRAQHELAAALLTALARTPRSGFVVDWPLIHRRARGWCCVLDASVPLDGPEDRPSEPVVFVSVEGRYATGQLSLSLAAVVLEDAGDPPGWVRPLVAALSPDSRLAVRQGLVARGLA